MLAQLKLAAILRVCYLAVIPLLVLPGCGGGAASTTNGGNGNGGGTSNVSVSVSPKRAAVAMTAQTQQFTAPVTGDSQNRGISGSVDGTAGGNATVGSISSSGLYTPQQAVAHTIAATSVADATNSASATVAVTDHAAVFTYRYKLAARRHQHTGVRVDSVQRDRRPSPRFKGTGPLPVLS
jgi:hypothetical protein